MNPKKLRTDEQLVGEQQLAAGQKAAREFGSVEELLQHDAAQTSVPPAIAARLQESMAKEPAAPTGWWRRLLGG